MMSTLFSTLLIIKACWVIWPEKGRIIYYHFLNFRLARAVKGIIVLLRGHVKGFSLLCAEVPRVTILFPWTDLADKISEGAEEAFDP